MKYKCYLRDTKSLRNLEKKDHLIIIYKYVCVPEADPSRKKAYRSGSVTVYV
jgi:hypothetical protein